MKDEVCVQKLRIRNYKKFRDSTFEFNNDLNILVGDNDSGKSTVLEALELVLNCGIHGRPVSGQICQGIFNKKAVDDYLNGDGSVGSLPEIVVEAYLSGVPEYRGNNNSDEADSDGMFLRICFNEDLLDVYEKLRLAGSVSKALPVELYHIEWFSFSWKRVYYVTRKVKALVVDPVKMHPTHARTEYVSRILDSALGDEKRAALGIRYREQKLSFNQTEEIRDLNVKLDDDNEISGGSLTIGVDGSESRFESEIQVSVDGIESPRLGRGERHAMQVKFSLKNKADSRDIILIEEPENHLSHVNLMRLVDFIEDRLTGKQLFLATHSSYVLNKLSLDKLCLIGDGYRRLQDVSRQIVREVKRLPGYDTLRIVLSKRTILVEGPSDELVLRKCYAKMKGGARPEEHGIDIIVVGGLGFRNYVHMAICVGVCLHVVRDNDGNYKNNVSRYADSYREKGDVHFFSDLDDDNYSLEPSLISCNSKDEESLDRFSKIILSAQTFNKYKERRSKPCKIEFLKEWFRSEGAGRKKVDSAMKIFDSDEDLVFPDYIRDSLVFNA